MRTPDVYDRTLVVAAALYCLLSAYTWWVDPSVQRIPFNRPDVVLFAVTGVAVLLQAMRFTRRTVLVAGTLLVTTWLSRGLLLLVALTAQRSGITTQRATLGVATWTLASLFAAYTWLRSFKFVRG